MRRPFVFLAFPYPAAINEVICMALGPGCIREHVMCQRPQREATDRGSDHRLVAG